MCWLMSCGRRWESRTATSGCCSKTGCRRTPTAGARSSRCRRRSAGSATSARRARAGVVVRARPRRHGDRQRARVCSRAWPKPTSTPRSASTRAASAKTPWCERRMPRCSRAAMVSIVRATARELRGSDCAVAARLGDAQSLEVLVGPPRSSRRARRRPRRRRGRTAGARARRSRALAGARGHRARRARRRALDDQPITTDSRVPTPASGKVRDVTPARLALVDDDQQFVEYLETLLRSRGYEVQPFTSGSDLLQSLHGDAPPDVVLLDVSMPGMDGLETLKAIRVAHPQRAGDHAVGPQRARHDRRRDAPGRARLRRQARRSRRPRRSGARSGDPQRRREDRPQHAKSRGCARRSARTRKARRSGARARRCAT